MPKTRPNDTVDLRINEHPSGRVDRIGGLTKREYFAIQLAAAIESNPDPHIVSGKTTQKLAVEGADALIDTLNRTRDNNG